MGISDRNAKDSFNGAQAVVIDCKGKHFDQLVFTPKGGPGLAYKKGPILAALEKGLPVVLKNLDLARSGTTDTLRPLLQFATGEMDALEIYSPAGDKASYNRQQAKGFDLGATVTRLSALPFSVVTRLDKHLSVEAPKGSRTADGPKARK